MVSDHEDTCTRLTGTREWDHRTLGPTVLTMDRVEYMNSNPTRVGTQPAKRNPVESLPPRVSDEGPSCGASGRPHGCYFNHSPRVTETNYEVSQQDNYGLSGTMNYPFPNAAHHGDGVRCSVRRANNVTSHVIRRFIIDVGGPAVPAHDSAEPNPTEPSFQR